MGVHHHEILRFEGQLLLCLGETRCPRKPECFQIEADEAGMLVRCCPHESSAMAYQTEMGNKLEKVSVGGVLRVVQVCAQSPLTCTDVRVFGVGSEDIELNHLGW